MSYEIDESSLERARALHASSVVLDSHVDTTQYLGPGKRDLTVRNETGHVDIPRLVEGGVSAVVFAVYGARPARPGAGIALVREQLRLIDAMIETHDVFEAARTADEVRSARARGRIAILKAIEGGYLLEDDLDMLREVRDAGAIYVTLTHAFNTSWGDSAGVYETPPPEHGGLTSLGREAVAAMNELGLMVDVSHVSDATFRDVLEASEAPVLATHSSCRAVNEHPRNLTDDMMRALAKQDGVVQLNFSAPFLDPEFPHITPAEYQAHWESGSNEPITDYRSPFARLVEHYLHAIACVGAGAVGTGSDFDGVAALPAGMGDCSRLPWLTAALLERDIAEEDLRWILGENFLRVMTAVQAQGSPA
ncbi:MAG: membrane dipeptidase [Gemmatimonadetes bacterium]|nr:membrane dipeptidase [Gemmatimonadota bacterium]